MIEAILAKFENARPAGKNQWQARCPVHDDRTASLCIGLGDDGCALIFCQAKCATDDVLSAVGLAARDLFPANGNGHKAPNQKRRIKTVYDYRNEAGELLFQAVRFEPKGFSQRRPDGADGYVWNLQGVPRVLYRLPELLAADLSTTVFVVEGERDVDELRSRGLVAACNPQGAGKWRSEFNEHLRARAVVILPDNDKAGRDHARQVARALQGIAACVKIAELPGLPDKGDVSDWLAAGGTVEELQRLAGDAPEWQPATGISPMQVRRADASGVPGIEVEEGQTDNANADRVLATHGTSLLFVERRKCWLGWGGTHWAEDHGIGAALAKDHAKSLWATFGAIAPSLEAQSISKVMKFVKNSNNGASIASVEKLMRSDSRVRVPNRDLSAVFDVAPHLLNVRNGTIDLRSGELRPHDRTDRITRTAPVDFDPNAGCPQWREFLRWATQDERDLCDFLQRAMGSALWGEVRDHVLLIFYGTGRNGKGTLLSVLRTILGEYAMEAAKDLLIERKHEGHATERAVLFGKRLVTCTESARRAHLDEALVKVLTGGDTVTARGMRENLWSFRPSHTLVLATNHRPRISGTDLGIWSRIRIVPFRAKITDADKDTGLAAKLEAEAPGILAWLVVGCRLWQADGFKLIDPQAVTDATAEYREASDLLGPFFAECTIEQPGGSVKFAELRTAYLAWCECRGITQPMGERTFREDLDARGFEGKPGAKGVKMRLGLVLR